MGSVKPSSEVESLRAQLAEAQQERQAWKEDAEIAQRRLAAFEKCDALLLQEVGGKLICLNWRDAEIERLKQERDTIKDQIAMLEGLNRQKQRLLDTLASEDVQDVIFAAESRLALMREALEQLFAVYKGDGDGFPPTFGRYSIRKAWDAARAFLRQQEVKKEAPTSSPVSCEARGWLWQYAAKVDPKFNDDDITQHDIDTLIAHAAHIRTQIEQRAIALGFTKDQRDALFGRK